MTAMREGGIAPHAHRSTKHFVSRTIILLLCRCHVFCCCWCNCCCLSCLLWVLYMLYCIPISVSYIHIFLSKPFNVNMRARCGVCLTIFANIRVRYNSILNVIVQPHDEYNKTDGNQFLDVYMRLFTVA